MEWSNVTDEKPGEKVHRGKERKRASGWGEKPYA